MNLLKYVDLYITHCRVMADGYRVFDALLTLFVMLPIVLLAAVVVLITAPIHFPIYCFAWLFFPKEVKALQAREGIGEKKTE